MVDLASIRGQLMMANHGACEGIKGIFAASRDLSDDLGLCGADAAEAAALLEAAASRLRSVAATIAAHDK